VKFIINKHLTNSAFKDDMIKEMQSKYMAENVDKWLNNCDRFVHLFGFEDFVYDLSTRPPDFLARQARRHGYDPRWTYQVASALVQHCSS
jgi:threonyl-tRNA synthetase